MSSVLWGVEAKSALPPPHRHNERHTGPGPMPARSPLHIAQQRPRNMTGIHIGSEYSCACDRAPEREPGPFMAPLIRRVPSRRRPRTPAEENSHIISFVPLLPALNPVCAPPSEHYYRRVEVIRRTSKVGYHPFQGYPLRRMGLESKAAAEARRNREEQGKSYNLNEGVATQCMIPGFYNPTLRPTYDRPKSWSRAILHDLVAERPSSDVEPERSRDCRSGGSPTLGIQWDLGGEKQTPKTVIVSKRHLGGNTDSGSDVVGGKTNTTKTKDTKDDDMTTNRPFQDTDANVPRRESLTLRRGSWASRQKKASVTRAESIEQALFSDDKFNAQIIRLSDEKIQHETSIYKLDLSPTKLVANPEVSITTEAEGDGKPDDNEDRRPDYDDDTRPVTNVDDRGPDEVDTDTKPVTNVEDRGPDYDDDTRPVTNVEDRGPDEVDTDTRPQDTEDEYDMTTDANSTLPSSAVKRDIKLPSQASLDMADEIDGEHRSTSVYSYQYSGLMESRADSFAPNIISEFDERKSALRQQEEEEEEEVLTSSYIEVPADVEIPKEIAVSFSVKAPGHDVGKQIYVDSGYANCGEEQDEAWRVKQVFGNAEDKQYIFVIVKTNQGEPLVVKASDFLDPSTRPAIPQALVSDKDAHLKAITYETVKTSILSAVNIALAESTARLETDVQTVALMTVQAAISIALDATMARYTSSQTTLNSVKPDSGIRHVAYDVVRTAIVNAVDNVLVDFADDTRQTESGLDRTASQAVNEAINVALDSLMTDGRQEAVTPGHMIITDGIEERQISLDSVRIDFSSVEFAMIKTPENDDPRCKSPTPDSTRTNSPPASMQRFPEETIWVDSETRIPDVAYSTVKHAIVNAITSVLFKDGVADSETCEDRLASDTVKATVATALDSVMCRFSGVFQEANHTWLTNSKHDTMDAMLKNHPQVHKAASEASLMIKTDHGTIRIAYTTIKPVIVNAVDSVLARILPDFDIKSCKPEDSLIKSALGIAVDRVISKIALDALKYEPGTKRVFGMDVEKDLVSHVFSVRRIDVEYFRVDPKDLHIPESS